MHAPICLDESRRDEAIEAGWIAYQDRLSGMKDKYLSYCEEWQVVAVVAGEEVIGALYAKDGVTHIGIKPEWQKRWASRRLINQMLSYGRKTTVQHWEVGCLEFIGRIGFKPSTDGFEIEGDCRVYRW